jgi:hypothetical protein
MDRARTGLALAFVGAMVLVGCRPTHHPTQYEAVYDRIVTASFDSMGGRAEDLPSGAYHWRPWWLRKSIQSAPSVPVSPKSKIDPRLRQWLADSSLATRHARDHLIDTVTIAVPLTWPAKRPGANPAAGRGPAHDQEHRVASCRVHARLTRS